MQRESPRSNDVCRSSTLLTLANLERNKKRTTLQPGLLLWSISSDKAGRSSDILTGIFCGQADVARARR
jgi:hypothetical protein